MKTFKIQITPYSGNIYEINDDDQLSCYGYMSVVPGIGKARILKGVNSPWNKLSIEAVLNLFEKYGIDDLPGIYYMFAVDTKYKENEMIEGMDDTIKMPLYSLDRVPLPLDTVVSLKCMRKRSTVNEFWKEWVDSLPEEMRSEDYDRFLPGEVLGEGDAVICRSSYNENCDIQYKTGVVMCEKDNLLGVKFDAKLPTREEYEVLEDGSFIVYLPSDNLIAI